MKRSGRFYRRNEAEIMKLLGLEPTPNSGSGWVTKEDGQSENIICQLKSTDASSIRVTLQDLNILSYNASVAHKLPVFAIQFLGSNDVYLLVKPDQLQEVSNYIESGEVKTRFDFVGVDLTNHDEIENNKSIDVKSNESARELYKRENENKYKREKKAR